VPQKEPNAAFLVRNAVPDNSKCVDQRKDVSMMLAEEVVPASARVAAATGAFAAATKALTATAKAFL
jgi:hypothetical protein